MYKTIKMTLNPFNANLTVTNAEGLELFKQATEGLPESKHFNMDQQHAKQQLIEVFSDFSWGPIVTKIVVCVNGADTGFDPLESSGFLDMSTVTAEANKRWGTTMTNLDYVDTLLTA